MNEPLTLGALCERYVEQLVEHDGKKLGPRRANLSRVMRHLDASETVPSFLAAVEERFAVLHAVVPYIPASSIRAMRSALVGAIRWGVREGHFRIDDAVAARCGLVAPDSFAHWSAHPRALTIFKQLACEMAVAGLTVDDLDEEFLSAFLDGLCARMASWRSCWSAFASRWRALASEGLVPDLELPRALDRSHGRYAARREDLPETLRTEVAAMEIRLVAKGLDDRGGSPPLDGSTRELVVGTVMRLLGFLRDKSGVDLSKCTLRAALSLEHAKALLAYTETRFRARMGLDPLPPQGVQEIGEYQVGLLRQLATVVRRGIGDLALHAEYAEEIKFVEAGARSRRESRKQHGHVDDYYRVAEQLAARAINECGKRSMSVRTALLIRDALIFALLAAHGYRRALLASINLSKHVRCGQDGVIVICVPREATKPGLRDLQLEVPRELLGLWHLYITMARPLLLKRKRTDELFVAQNGDALGGSAIYAVVVSRSIEVLGVQHNPHQARKAIATDHGLWSQGDYLSASAVLDSSPLTLQRNYVTLDRERQVSQFDAATAGDWHDAKGRSVA